MSTWTSDQVAQALGAAAPARLTFTGVTTDTRHLVPGTLFVALKGERFDAHDFLTQAKAAGATGAVVRRGTPPVPGLTLFEVADTLTALGLLARARRRLLPKDAPVVAVTGSSGKTSAKEMIRSALATQRRVHATSGNLNNLVGVPLTILAAPDDANALVVEAGASLPGEIGKLRDIIEPTIAVVTNVGFAHLEGFGTTERLLQEKASLLDGAPVAVVGNSPALVAQARRRARKVVVVARDEFGEVHPDKVDVDDAGQPILHWMGTSVTLPVLGLHQVDNAMIALAVAREAGGGVDLKAAVAALATVQIPAGRGGLVSKGSLTIMDDSYNANPDSILAALETALTYAARRRRPLVVVLGSMLELGPESARLHAFVADELMSYLPAPEVVAAVGDFVPAFARYREALGERLITAPDAETLGPLLKRALRGNEIVLLKASRGVALERVLRHLT